MRITAAIAATALTLTTPAAPESELEALLDDVTATRTTSLDALEDADGDDEVREILTEWRKDLIDAADTVADLREDAGELTEDEEAEFDDAADAIKAERAGVRKLRAELLLDDDTVVVPTAAEELSGLYGTTFFDALERSEDGDVRIVYAIPGADTTTTEPTVTAEPTPAATNLRLRAERMQETTTETSTESSPSSSESSTETSPTETTESSTTTSSSSPSTTSSSSTAPSIMQNRTTSATSTTSKSTTRSSSSTSRTTTTSNERDDDLADTGTPMRGLIGLGALALLAGVAFLLPGSRAARR
ncbi:hypothetical protein [Corynebacterium lujinxingii]|uniref:Uncharacterized protein n=1 Tax=Corynebacterium lujinxingii TaxID=2763010 RepID=A0A7H0JY82_9CORY|nr:hypothetical protein [Corynebacterium lujinxingii]MBC3178304.1 hypothetical protein [Corynebacterium lujinxingii]NNO10818.1 hypothetical protein [Corynebacterium lujinxingii]QNP89998.1 hypothetical protein IAU68_10130 [Corynebacterium lujinxingii]